MSLGKDWSRKLIAEFIFSIFTHAMKMNGLGYSPKKNQKNYYTCTLTAGK
jgi:hypothetical protein